MLDDNVKGGPSTPWSRLKDPVRILSRPPSPIPRPAPDGGPGPVPGPKAARVQSVFAILGIVAAIAGLVWSWAAEHSIALSLFVSVVVLVFVGVLVGDAATRKRKARCFLAYALFPILCSGILLGVHRLWGMWWLAALLGLAGGLVLWTVVVATVFPDVIAEGGTGTDLE